MSKTLDFLKIEFSKANNSGTVKCKLRFLTDLYVVDYVESTSVGRNSEE